MLKEFLEHQFIHISEDENLAKLNKASAEIVKTLQKNKAKIISYTLVALDPLVSPKTIEINEVSEIISNKHWRTFIPNTKDTPVTYIRAVMLEVLKRLANDIELACLIWLTGRNVIRYYNLGREKELLASFLLELGNRIEREVNNS